jgi:signal transduction histidine kinase
MPSGLFRRVIGSFRARLIVWNALGVAVVGLATTIALRFLVSAALLADLDAVLKQDAQEILLDMQAKYPAQSQAFFDDMERKAQAHELFGWYVRVIDHRGRQIWANPHAPPQSSWAPNEVGMRVAEKNGYRVVQFSFTPPDRGPTTTVRVGSSLGPMRRAMSRFDRVASLISLAVLVVSPILGYSLGNSMIRPLTDLTRRADELQPHRLATPLPLRGVGDELDQLSHTINRLLERLARYVNERQDYLSNAAHELRTPLAALRSAIEVTLDRDRTAAEYQEVLVRLMEECESLESLMRQLLLLAESESPRNPIARETLDWCAVARTAAAMFEAAAEVKGVRLETDIEPRLLVQANATHLRQVVNNLLDNAVKYTPAGGTVRLLLRRVDAPLDVSKSRSRPPGAAEDRWGKSSPPSSTRDKAAEDSNNGGWGELQVDDTGIGIDELDVPRVFERFFRADRARQKESVAGGSGLGLSICQAIVLAHGGSIGLRSRLGEGTTVSVRLPLVLS